MMNPHDALQSAAKDAGLAVDTFLRSRSAPVLIAKQDLMLYLRNQGETVWYIAYLMCCDRGTVAYSIRMANARQEGREISAAEARKAR